MDYDDLTPDSLPPDILTELADFVGGGEMQNILDI